MIGYKSKEDKPSLKNMPKGILTELAYAFFIIGVGLLICLILAK